MPRAIYIVIFSGSNWWVDLEGKAYGPFPTREAAKQQAIVLAAAAGSTGRQREVRVPDDRSRYTVAWETEPYRFRAAKPASAHAKSVSETPAAANQP
jgi:hypothetical protein